MRHSQRCALPCATSLALTLLLSPPTDASSTERVSLGLAQGNGDADAFTVITADGRFVLFGSAATNLVAGDTNGAIDLFLRDRQAATTTRVGLTAAGGQPNADAYSGWISPDGRYVTWTSGASNVVPGDTNGAFDSFLRDLTTGITTRVSESASGAGGDAGSYEATISADGRYVAFWSHASNLVPGDTNGVGDCFVRDRKTGSVARISVGLGGAQANGESYFPTITPDGRYVIFSSLATNLVPGDANGAADVFRFDRTSGTIELVSVATGGGPGNGPSSADAWGVASTDGRHVAFQSDATNLVAGDTNGHTDAFVRDMLLGTTTRVSLAESGAEPNAGCYLASISGDGHYATFNSAATNVVPGDGLSHHDCFRYDMQTGGLVNVSRTTAGSFAHGDSSAAVLSFDGRFVAFVSEAADLVAGDTNARRDVFVYTDCWVTFAEYGAGTPGSGAVTPHLVGEDGSCEKGGYGVRLEDSLGGTVGLLVIGVAPAATPALGGTVLIDLALPAIFVLLPIPGPPAAGQGVLPLPTPSLATIGDVTVRLQFLLADPGAPAGVSMSQALTMTVAG